MPNLRRVAVLWVPSGRESADYRDQIAAACARLGLTALPIAANSVDDLGPAISAAAAGAEAPVPVRSPLFGSPPKRISEIPPPNPLPANYSQHGLVPGRRLPSG